MGGPWAWVSRREGWGDQAEPGTLLSLERPTGSGHPGNTRLCHMPGVDVHSSVLGAQSPLWGCALLALKFIPRGHWLFLCCWGPLGSS